MTTAKKTAAAKSADAKLEEKLDKNDDVSVVDSGDVLTREESIEDAKGKQLPDEERTPTSIAQPSDPNYPYTVEDANGVERIVSANPDNWEHPSSEPSEAAVKAAEEREKLEEERKQKRLDGLNSKSPDDGDKDNDGEKDKA